MALTTIRKTFALVKSLGATLYLVSAAFIATWIIVVFFGAGFLFLIHPSPKKGTSLLGADGPHHDVVLEENPWVFQSKAGAAGESARIAPVDGSGVVSNDTRWAARAEVSADRSTTDRSGLPLPSGFQPNASTLDEQPADFSAPSHPAEAMTRQTAPPSRKPYQLRPTDGKTPLEHPPVHAIEELFQTHSGLLR